MEQIELLEKFHGELTELREAAKRIRPLPNEALGIIGNVLLEVRQDIDDLKENRRTELPLPIEEMIDSWRKLIPEIEDPEQQLRQTIREESAERKASRKGHIERLEEAERWLVKEHQRLNDLTQSVVLTTDGEGNLNRTVMAGIAGGAPTKNSITRSNFRSVKRAMDTLGYKYLPMIQALCEQLRLGKGLRPDFDLEAFLVEMRAGIPKEFPLEVIGQKPGTAAPTLDVQRGAGESGGAKSKYSQWLREVLSPPGD